MKKFLICGLLLIGTTVFAKPSEHLTTADEIVTAFNESYPDLELAIVPPATDEAVAYELGVLASIIKGGAAVEDGSLIHLACCAPACGNRCGNLVQE